MPEMRLTQADKEFVAQRAHHCCEYCGAQLAYSSDPFSVDHIVPRAQGGTNSRSNYAFACLGCNGRKGTATTARDPVDGTLAPLFHPRQDRWADHFVWSPDFSLIIGKTAIGRATVAKLDLNRLGNINLRRLLAKADRHPPIIAE